MGRKATGYRIRALAAMLLLFLVSGSGAVASLVVITPEGGFVSLDGAENAVRDAGGAVRHRFPGAGVIADLPPGAEGEVRRRLAGEYRVASEPLPASSPILAAWDRLIAPPDERGAAKAETGAPLAGDALVPPRSPEKGAGEGNYGPSGAGFWDGSEYFLGDVGVAVFLVESDGSIDPSSESWTAAERSHVESRLVEAMEWWRARAPEGMLRFTYEFHEDARVPYEPIARPQSDEDLWVRAALEPFGFTTGDRFSRTQSFLNDMKSRLGLDWAFAVYVVDSSSDPDGMFSDGYFAYAYVGGPYAVLTLDNDGWGMDNFASVCAHETGHIFYALDQYQAARVPCDRASGYAGAETWNSQYGDCPEEVPSCIMRSTHIGVATLSATARAQVGWGDDDGDGIPDPVGGAPSVAARSTASGDSIVVHGTVSIVPVPNRNPLGYGHDVSIETIAALEYRAGGGPWTAWTGLAAGASSSSFEFRIALSAGSSVKVRATTSAGAVTEAEVTPGGGTKPDASTDAPGPVRFLGNRPNPFNPSTDFHLAGDGITPVRLEIYDLRGARVRVVVDEILPAGESAVRWDGRDESGRDVPSGRYFGLVVAGPTRVAAPLTLLR